LPNIREIQSLMDYSITGSPGLPLGHPFLNFSGGSEWSSTTNAGAPVQAWGLVSAGVVIFLNKTMDFVDVTAVRGGS
jgi:hypothetical protein